MRGPNGERRPRDPIARAVHVAKIATGQIEDELPSATRRGGLVGGPKRTKALSPERRAEIARMGQRALQEKWAKEVA
jgi:hypothetical protein